MSDLFKNTFEKHVSYLRKKLNEAKDPKGDEGDDWVRPGSDLEPGMQIGATNFPHGMGYPNYKPKFEDDEDFKEVTFLDHISDVPYQHSDQDNKKRTSALYSYIKNKKTEFYNKFRAYIDNLFAKYDNYYDIHNWFVGFINLAKKEPTHKNVPVELQGIPITEDDIITAIKLVKVYQQLYSLIHHRDDPQNELNYPLYVSLYDITRKLGGYDEGGWWYDSYKLINSIQIKSPSQLLPTAEKLYTEIGRNFDGKPRICVEKEQGSQIKGPPKYR